jgi:hypothetical protein
MVREPAYPHSHSWFGKLVADKYGHVQSVLAYVAPTIHFALEISEEQMRVIQSSLSLYHYAVPNFRLPSRPALERYLNAYFTSFHPHLPFIHTSTLCITTCNVELVLAIACAGAQYRFEHKQSLAMFFAAKSILNERIKEREQTSMRSAQTTSSAHSSPYRSAAQSRNAPEPQIGDEIVAPDFMDDARCLLCLIVFAAWKSNAHVYRAAVSLQSMLVQSVRESGFDDAQAIARSPTNWRRWAREESDRRTKFLSFCFLNLMSHVYDHPPLLLANEINLRLPSSNEEWDSPGEEEWLACRMPFGEEAMTFREGMEKLLAVSPAPAVLSPAPSTLGSYVLLHGLLQKVLIITQSSLSITNSSRSLAPADLEALG